MPRGATERIGEYLKASDTGPGDAFGTAVALSADGSMLAIGAPGEDGSGTGVDPLVDEGAGQSGAVYVFRRAGASWVFDAYLKASDTGANDRFGSALAFDSGGTTLVVGAPGEASNASLLDPSSNEGVPGCGAVYVYERDAGGWSFTTRLKPSNPGSDLAFGGALDLSGDGAVLAIGAIPGHNGPSSTSAAGSTRRCGSGHAARPPSMRSERSTPRAGRSMPAACARASRSSLPSSSPPVAAAPRP